MPLSTLSPTAIPVKVPSLGGSRPPLGSFSTEKTRTASSAPPFDAVTDSNVSTPSSSSSSSDSSASLDALPLTPPPPSSAAPLFVSTASTSAPTKSPPRPPSSSALTLTFSAHTSIPESTCRNPRVTAHPFSVPFSASSRTHDYTKPATSSGSSRQAPPKTLSESEETTRELDEDAWFFYSANQGLTDVSNAGDYEGTTGSDSLLLFRERQRQYFRLKQVRERELQRQKKRKIEEEAEASDTTVTEGTTGRNNKKVRMDSPGARQAGRDVDGDVEMGRAGTSTPPPAGGQVYSRTLSLRSPSPSSSTSSSRDQGTQRRDRSSVKSSAAAAFWGIGGVGSSTRGVTPTPSSASSTSGATPRPGTSAGAVAGPGPRTLVSGGEGNRFTGSGGIGKGTGQAHTPWSSGSMAEASSEARAGTPPTHTAGPGAPIIQVNGFPVVKRTGEMGGAGKPRGLWRSRGTGPAPVTAPSTPAPDQGRTQIGGFVFGSNFLAGSSLHHRHLGKYTATAASASTTSTRRFAEPHPAPHRGPPSRFKNRPKREESGGEDAVNTGGAKRERSGSVSSCSSSSSSGCATAGESDGESEAERRVRRPLGSSSRKTSYRSSSHGRASRPRDIRSQGQSTMAPTKVLDYLGRGPVSTIPSGQSGRGSTTPTLGRLALEPESPGKTRASEKRQAGSREKSDDESAGEADISDDVERKRKHGLKANTQHKRRRTSMPELGSLSTHGVASSTSSAPSRRRMNLTSTGVQHGEGEGESVTKRAKYVTRSKVMDTTSLAGVDPAVMASRKQGADSSTKVDSSTSTDSSPHHSERPASPSEYPFPPVRPPPRKPLVTLEDWEDLKEVWNRCLEMMDAEEPEDVMPLLRGIIHECSWFLHEFEDPSVIFMSPQKAEPPSPLTERKPESDVDMSGDSTPPASVINKGPSSGSSSGGGHRHRHRHHHLCQHHENNRHRATTSDLPTAFHSILGTALFLFGNIIGANPDLALDGEPRTSTVYHLYALDVFEFGESLPSKTFTRRHDAVVGTDSVDGPGNEFSDMPVPSASLSSLECCAQGMKEDWQMAVTWGRALVSLAEDLLEREKVVEEANQTALAHAERYPGAAFQLHQQPFESPAAFLSEDFCIPTFMRGGGYFGGTGGQAMGLTLNGMGVFVPVGTGVGGALSAFHSPAAALNRPGSGDSFWSAGSGAPAGSDSGRTSSSSVTRASGGSSGSSTTMSSLANTPAAPATPRLPAFADSHHQPHAMYPSSAFLSPSFIASSSRDAFGSSQGRGYTPSSTPTGSISTPGSYTDPRRLWQDECPFMVIRSRMPPVTRRMSLGVGSGTSVDEMMTLAVDQFSRGILHLPKAVLSSEASEDAVRDGSTLHGHGHGRHRKHQHHHHHHQHAPKDDHGYNAATAASPAIPSSFSRANHLYTIAVQVMLLAEKLTNPESRYKWGRYADSVFGQMKLEESPTVEVVSVTSESFTGALNYGVGEAMEVVDEGQGMDVDEEGQRGREDARSAQHHHHHRHGHHRHKHGHHVAEGGGAITRSSSAHPHSQFLNSNSNPDILKARGRCALIIGGALAEDAIEGPLEEVLGSYNEEDGGEMDKATRDKVKQILEGEDAVEARERLEEAVRLLGRAREVWRKDFWGPRKKTRESARRKRGREREKVEQEAREKERQKREEKERLQRERAGPAQVQVETQKKRDVKGKDGKLGKRRGIGKIAADNKRAAAFTTSPPSSATSSSFSPSSKGKERAVPATLFPTASELNTPESEVAAAMRALQSPGTEVPPVSPEPSGGEEAGMASTDYFPPTPDVASTLAGDTFNTSVQDAQEEDERIFTAQEEEEEMEEVDLASLIAEALVMLAELQVEKGDKEALYRRAREEAGRAGKAGLVEEELGEMMNVDS